MLWHRLLACPYHGETSWWKVKGADGLEEVESLRLLMKLQTNQLEDNIYYIHDIVTIIY